MNTIPTPRTDAAFDALSRGACGLKYIQDLMMDLEREAACLRTSTEYELNAANQAAIEAEDDR